MSLLARLDQLRVFGLRELRARPGRTFALVVVMAISAAFLVAMIGISGSVTGTVREVADTVSGDAAIEVSGITDSGFDQDVLQIVAETPGVRVAAPLVRTLVDTTEGSAMLLGADLSGSALDSPLIEATKSHIGALLGTPGSVLVGPALAREPGSEVAIGDRTFVVAGVVDGISASRVNQGYFVMAPLGVAQEITGRSGRLDSVLVAVEPGVSADSVRKELTTAVGGRAVVGDSLQRVAQTGPGIQILQYLTLTSAGVAFVVAAFLIYTVMSISISQRRRALSVLRAVGGQPETLVLNLLGEAAALGLIGGLVGAAVGTAVGRVVVSSVPTALVQSTNLRLEYWLPWYAAPVAVALSVIMAVAAATIAAVRIYRVSPLEALVPAEAAIAGGPPRWLRLLALVGGVGSLALAVGISLSGTVVPWLAASTIVLFFGFGVALCVALTPQLVTVTASLARRCGSSGRLAAAAVERSSTRVWATLMTVMIAVAMTVTITGANRDTVDAATTAMSSYADTTLFVSENRPDQLPVGAPLPDELPGQLRNLPGVTRVAEVRIAFASLDGVKIALNGVSEGSSNPIYRAIDDAGIRSDLLAGRGVVLSKSLGQSLGVAAGDTVSLPTPHGLQSVRVLQLVPYLSVVSGVVAMSLDKLHSMFDLPGATLLEIYATPGIDVDALRAAVRNLAPPDAHDFTGVESIEIGVKGSLRQVTAIADAMWLIVVVIAAIALLNTLTMSVLQRRRELGVFRAIGASPWQVLQMIVVEAACIGLVGGTIGLAFGLAGQYFYDLASPAVLNFAVGYDPDPSAVGFAALAVLLCLLGCIPPAIRAGKVDIVPAINAD